MMFESKYFNIGMLAFTHAVNDTIAENTQFAKDVVSSIKRYIDKDWGEISYEDKEVNDEALKFPDNLYLFAAYKTCKGKIYIITNRKSEIAGDNATTVLFPDEY